MKKIIKEEINKLYYLFETPPKIDVKSVKQHVESFAFNTQQINHLRKAVNEIISSGRCAWCSSSKVNVQDGFKDDLSRKEYQLSALCQTCQDDVFTEENNDI